LFLRWGLALFPGLALHLNPPTSNFPVAGITGHHSQQIGFLKLILWRMLRFLSPQSHVFVKFQRFQSFPLWILPLLIVSIVILWTFC
jgi:hypothetical protein